MIGMRGPRKVLIAPDGIDISLHGVISARRVLPEQENTRAEKPKKREKFKKRFQEVNEKPKEEKSKVSRLKDEVKKKGAATPEKKEKDSSCYLQVFPGTEKKKKENDSYVALA